MTHFSVTISGLLVVMLGLVIDDQELVSTLAADIVTVLGILVAWYGRYRQGDISIAGAK